MATGGTGGEGGVTASTEDGSRGSNADECYDYRVPSVSDNTRTGQSSLPNTTTAMPTTATAAAVQMNCYALSSRKVA